MPETREQPCWLADEAGFEAFCREQSQRLAARVQERRAFLERVCSRLEELHGLARGVGDADAANELFARLQEAAAERDRLTAQVRQFPAEPDRPAEPAPAVPPPDLVSREESAGPPAPTAAVVSPPPPAPADNAPAAPPQPEASAPAPAPGPRAAKREAPAKPAWEPLSLDELAAELQDLQAGLAAIAGADQVSLARFKSLLCRFRALRRHRRRRPGSQKDWEMFRDQAFAVLNQNWPSGPSGYVVPLHCTDDPEPQTWETLAETFGRLAEAQGTMDWITGLIAQQELKPAECRACLESVAAISGCLQRCLNRELPGQTDPQQQKLCQRLKELSRECNLPLKCLRENVSDAVLAREAEKLAQESLALREMLDGRRARERALQAFEELVGSAGWEDEEDAAARMIERAAACLAAGVPATERRLRDPLLPFEWMLDEEPEVQPLLRAVHEKNNRQAAQANAEAANVATAWRRWIPSPDLEPRLEEVLPQTRGRRAVMIGGTPRPDNREAVADLLDLARLDWPEMDESASHEKILAAVGDAEIVFVNRFNRKKVKVIYPHCRALGIPVVSLPGGYGAAQVLVQTHESFFRRRPKESG